MKALKNIEAHCRLLPGQSKPYIDSTLGQLRGEVESEKIFNLGFKNLYIETGYVKGAIRKPDWILEIHPKSPEEIFGSG